jgi:molecular chaperone GrpE
VPPPDARAPPRAGAGREQPRAPPGPRASSAPAETHEAPESQGDAGADRGFVEAPSGEPADEAEPGTDESAPREDADATDAALEAEATGAPSEEADPLAEAERSRDEYLSLAQRTQADFDNFRRRAARETAAAGARAKAGLVRELLPALDNLERALAAAGDADDGFARGVQMVHAEIVAALERNGVAAFEPSGERFDPSVHEALSTRPADDAEAGVVLEVIEKGYRLEDTVLRPARVVVSA